MTTVNRPTNVKQKEADVNQKLQLYGIYSGTSVSHRSHFIGPAPLCAEFLALRVFVEIVASKGHES